MATSDQEGKKSFTVKDNRRFDDAGSERATTEYTSTSSADKPASKTVPSQEPDTAHGEINFSSFLMSFATQALMQLGLIPPPDGIPVQPDALAAKQSIDILAMLEEKTKGNLNEEESRLMKEALYSLRLSFVKATKK